MMRGREEGRRGQLAAQERSHVRELRFDSSGADAREVSC